MDGWLKLSRLVGFVDGRTDQGNIICMKGKKESSRNVITSEIIERSTYLLT